MLATTPACTLTSRHPKALGQLPAGTAPRPLRRGRTVVTVSSAPKVQAAVRATTRRLRGKKKTPRSDLPSYMPGIAIAVRPCMSNSRTPEAEASSRSPDRPEGELPVQPSSLPSPSAEQPPTAMTPIAEPIPPNELPAPSPLPDRGQRRSTRSVGSLALLFIVLVVAGIGIMSATKNTTSERHPAETAPLQR
jgi:hypothetical protein